MAGKRKIRPKSIAGILFRGRNLRCIISQIIHENGDFHE
jgi:hypothetical protein